MKNKNLLFLPLFFITTIVVVFLDQLSKYLITIINPNWQAGFLFFRIAHNTGASFGLLQNKTFLLSIISLMVVTAIIIYYPKIPKQKIPQILFATFLGGAIGNLIDRLFRGYVIDFIGLTFWPTFNVADSFITLSVVGMAIYFWKNQN